MGDINAATLPELEWRDYYPRFGGWNDTWPENERWHVKIRRSASREQARKIWQALAVEREAAPSISDWDMGIVLLGQHIQGPFNLTNRGEPIANLKQLFEVVDSQELFIELQQEIEREIKLTEEEGKNSDALSGGDSDSPDSAEKTDLARVSLVSQTPTPRHARPSTTRTGVEPSRSEPREDRQATGKAKTQKAR
ncbi:MAG: hypothetical protein ACE5EX_10325 [Phycisphaerae bacterium]